MYKVFKTLAMTLVSLSLVGCASTSFDNLSKVEIGMDKDSVLGLSGSPWLTRRVNSNDLWVYRYFKGEQQYRQEILFNKGLVAKIKSAKPYPDSDSNMKKSVDMDEYSKAANMKNKKYEKGFKDVEPPEE